MHVFYFLTPQEHFELLKDLCVNWKTPVGIVFRRFSPSGFDPGFEICCWDEDLASKYLHGGYSEVYLSMNNSGPEGRQDWEYPERECHDMMIMEGGRLSGNELENAYLRVFAKQSQCVPLYRKLRRVLKQSMYQGLYSGKHYYKDIFYSGEAAQMRMVGKFGGHEYVEDPTT